MALGFPLLAFVVIASADDGGTPTAPSTASARDATLLFAWSAASLFVVFAWRGWRPGALDGPAWRPSVPTGLAAAVAIVASGVVGGALARVLWPASLGGGDTALLIGGALASVMVAAAVVSLRRRLFERSHGHPSRIGWAVVAGAVGLAVAWPLVQVSMLLGAWLSHVLAGAEVPALAHESLRLIQDDPRSVRTMTRIAVAVVAAPFVEEVLYRGVIQQMCRAAGMRVAWAVSLSAALFALMHLGDGAVTAASASAALPALFLLGVLFGVLYERTGRLAAPVAAHALFNAANVVVLLWQPSPTLPAP